MTCAVCLGPAALLPGVAESEALCLDHLRALYLARKRWRCQQCGARLLLPPPDRICRHCTTPRSVDVSTTVLPIPILRGADYKAWRALQATDAAELEKTVSDTLDEHDDEFE